MLTIAIAVGCAAISLLCHRIIKAIEANRLFPLRSDMRGLKYNWLFRTTSPFRDEYQRRFVQRSLIHALLWMWKWVTAFAAVLVGVVSPLVYAVRLWLT